MGYRMAKKTKAKGRVRTRKSKSLEKLAPNSPIANSPEMEQTLADIERTGSLPDNATLEDRFPGITASGHARKEFMLITIFNLRLRGYRIHKIAEVLKVNPSTIGFYCQEMKKTFEKEAAGISFMGQVGRSVATFRELQAEASKMFHGRTVNGVVQHMDDINKLRALELMARMENSIINTLAKGGFFLNARLAPQHSSEGGRSEVDNMQRLIEGLFHGNFDRDEDAENITEENFVLTDDDVSVLRLS